MFSSSFFLAKKTDSKHHKKPTSIQQTQRSLQTTPLPPFQSTTKQQIQDVRKPWTLTRTPGIAQTLPQNQPHYYEISCIDEADDESTAATNGLVTGTATNDVANGTANTTACHSVTVQWIHPQFQGYVSHHRYHACFLEILTMLSHLS
jgi:hypothetical protein